MASLPAIDWGEFESDLDPRPEFFVQAPDGRRDWSELKRQATLFRVMRHHGPRVRGHAVPNAGKRNPQQAIREGIKSGVFDTSWAWRRPLVAWIELKGYDKRGQPGSLSRQQIEWGNSMHALGYPVACFFDPYDAANWLRELGFPVTEVLRPQAYLDAVKQADTPGELKQRVLLCRDLELITDDEAEDWIAMAGLRAE